LSSSVLLLRTSLTDRARCLLRAHGRGFGVDIGRSADARGPTGQGARDTESSSVRAPTESPIDKAAALLERLGLAAVILLAAFVCDVAILVPAAFDSYGPRGRDLLMFPGIAALAGCALWARSRPAVAAFVGAAVLVASSVLLRVFEVQPYRTVLANVSLTETVAGFELVYYCVRRVRGGVAFAGVLSLSAR
jgi:hypothetical protein